MILGKVTKQPVDELDYDVDYSAWLGTSGDVLASCAVTVAPTGSLEIATTSVQPTMLKFWLSGGTAGTSYKLTINATTNGGRIKQDEVRVAVKDF